MDSQIVERSEGSIDFQIELSEYRSLMNRLIDNLASQQIK